MGKPAPFLLTEKTFQSVSGATVGAFGLGMAFFTYEAMRMSSLRSVEVASNFSGYGSAASVLILIFFAYVYRKHPAFRLHRRPVVGFLIACMSALSMVTLYDGGFWPSSIPLLCAARIINNIAQVLILLCWVELLAPLKARHVAVLVSLAFIILGLLSAFSACLRDYTACIIVATIPILSMVCLYWFKDMRNSLDEPMAQRSANAFSMFQVDESLLRGSAEAKKISAPFLFLIPFTCFSFIFGNVHYNWVPHQDGGFVSFTVQMAAGFGTALGGIALLILIAYLWGRRKIELYTLFALPVLMLALYMTSFIGNDLAFLYVIPLNISQKTLFLLIWMAPFLVPGKNSQLEPWCMALASYQLGKLLSITVSGMSATWSYPVGIVVAICLLSFSLVIGIVLDRNKGVDTQLEGFPDETESDLPIADEPTKYPFAALACDAYDKEATPHTGTAHTTTPATNSETSRVVMIEKCRVVASINQLTRREEEVLQLLVEGMTAQAIAQTLVVSTATAKSHLRNIYAKLNVHSQNELTLLVLHTPVK